jgi:diguanylate cyclase (GGDEF)-like protein
VLIGLVSLVSAGIFFMWATVPHRFDVSSRWMACVLVVTLSVYIVLLCLNDVPAWLLNADAAAIGLGPLAVHLASRRLIFRPIRWMLVGLQLGLAAALLISLHVQLGVPDFGTDAVLFTVYLGCCLHFWYTHRRWSVGAFITIGGFFAWAMVFVVAPSLQHFLPNFHLESEVWNLPKYVVAVGMLLLLLESQIERTEYLALHDDLTKLANRRLFQDRLIGSMERARRNGSSMGLLQIDLDRFKAVNDTFGHHMGDLLLQEVARRLEGRTRRSDTLSRTGGDEFSLVLEEPTLREDGEALATTLVRILSQPFMIAGKRIVIGASIGVAIYPEDALDFEALCVTADQRMYARKPNAEQAAEVAHR